MSRVIGIIPARYASSRFPGKPLAKIAGVTLLQRTYENAKKTNIFDDLVIATDDERIRQHGQEFKAHVVMTSESCPTGTDRLAECVQNFSTVPDDIILNIQGDVPLLEKEVIEKVVAALRDHPLEVMSTAASPMFKDEDAHLPSIVKCVLDNHHHALYFSRQLIPYSRDSEITYYHHLGIYGFRQRFLLHYAKLPATPLQLAEDLEQLKALEHGFKIKVAIAQSVSFGVDRPEDVEKMEKLLCR